MRKWIPVSAAVLCAGGFTAPAVAGLISAPPAVVAYASTQPAGAPVAPPLCPITSIAESQDANYGNTAAVLIGCPTTSDNCPKDQNGKCKE
jgi:hypothetical protein